MDGIATQAGMMRVAAESVYNPVDSIGATQGVGGWDFGYLTSENAPGTFTTSGMNWNGGFWDGPSAYSLPFSGAVDMHPMYDTPNSPAARRFYVPTTGTASVDGTSFKTVTGGDGVIVRLWHNSSLIYTRTIGYSDTTETDYLEDFSVTEGDYIVWECADGAGTDGGNDNTHFSGIVTIIS